MNEADPNALDGDFFITGVARIGPKFRGIQSIRIETDPEWVELSSLREVVLDRVVDVSGVRFRAVVVRDDLG